MVGLVKWRGNSPSDAITEQIVFCAKYGAKHRADNNVVFSARKLSLICLVTAEQVLWLLPRKELPNQFWAVGRRRRWS